MKHLQRIGTRAVLVMALPGIAAGCIRMPAIDASAPVAAARKEPGPSIEPFALKPDFNAEAAGACARAEVVDVNLGHTPESFVRAAHCQITGQPAPPKTVEQWTARMREKY